jgi:hypothetical protein
MCAALAEAEAPLKLSLIDNRLPLRMKVRILFRDYRLEEPHWIRRVAAYVMVSACAGLRVREQRQGPGQQ